MATVFVLHTEKKALPIRYYDRVVFLLSLFPRLFSAVTDWMSTFWRSVTLICGALEEHLFTYLAYSTHGVALRRI